MASPTKAHPLRFAALALALACAPAAATAADADTGAVPGAQISSHPDWFKGRGMIAPTLQRGNASGPLQRPVSEGEHGWAAVATSSPSRTSPIS